MADEQSAPWPARAIDEAYILELGKTLWSAVCVGNPCPHVEKLHRRMTNPRPGDLVMEITDFTRLTCGWLEKVAEERIGTSDNEERAFYIIRPGGYRERWVNAEFIALPWPGARWYHTEGL